MSLRLRCVRLGRLGRRAPVPLARRGRRTAARAAEGDVQLVEHRGGRHIADRRASSPGTSARSLAHVLVLESDEADLAAQLDTGGRGDPRPHELDDRTHVVGRAAVRWPG